MGACSGSATPSSTSEGASCPWTERSGTSNHRPSTCSRTWSRTATEIDAIRDISDDWRDGDFTFDKYLGPAIVRAQDAIAKDEVVELIDDIDARISSRVLRRALFSAAREVAGIDDDVSPAEGSILAEVAVRFG